MPDLGPRNTILPMAAIAGIVLASGGAFAWAAGWIGPHRQSGGDIVRSLDANGGGVHHGYRRAHAKGLCLAGSFAANGAGSALSPATIFRPGTYPVIGRFSTGAATRWRVTGATSSTPWR